MTRMGMLLDLKRCVGCGSCVVACQLENCQKPGVSWNKLDEVEWGEEVGESGRAYIPHACMHCTDAPCVAVCPTGASIVLDNGIVIVDYESCINCGSCITACPYGAREENNSTEYYFGASDPAPYEEYGIQRTQVVEKCIFCYKRVEEGLSTACTLNCPPGARFFGDLEDPESDINIRLERGDAVQIDDTSFYYVPVDGMPEEALPFAASIQAKPEEPKSEEEGGGGIDPVVIGVGAAAVAAVGVGVGVGVHNHNKKKSEGGDQ